MAHIHIFPHNHSFLNELKKDACTWAFSPINKHAGIIGFNGPVNISLSKIFFTFSSQSKLYLYAHEDLYNI